MAPTCLLSMLSPELRWHRGEQLIPPEHTAKTALSMLSLGLACTSLDTLCPGTGIIIVMYLEMGRGPIGSELVVFSLDLMLHLIGKA